MGRNNERSRVLRILDAHKKDLGPLWLRPRDLRILDAHKKDLGPLWLRLRNLIEYGESGELVYKPKATRKKRKP